MAVDDAVWIHERSGDFLARLVSQDALPFGLSSVVIQFPTFYWFLIMGPFFAAIGLFMLAFLWRRFEKVGLRKYLLCSLAGLGGAMLIDFAEDTGRGLPGCLGIEEGRLTMSHNMTIFIHLNSGQGSTLNGLGVKDNPTTAV